MDQPKNVLLIEDNSGDARLVQEMLSETSSQSFTLERAERLAAGLDRLATGGVDVVLLDMALPDGFGLENFNKVNALAPHLPIVLMTGSVQDAEVAKQAVQCGAQDYLIKGQVNGVMLVRSLLYAVERKRATEELRKANDALQAKVHELEMLNRVMMNREQRIVELKKEVSDLKTRHGGTHDSSLSTEWQ